MRATETLAVGQVEGRAAVLQFLPVVREHPVAGRGLPATTAILGDSFAAGAGPGDDGLAPGAVFGCVVDRLGLLWGWLDAACVQGRDGLSQALERDAGAQTISHRASRALGGRDGKRFGYAADAQAWRGGLMSKIVRPVSVMAETRTNRCLP